MAESTKPGRSRARRSTRVSRQLEGARRRFTEQLAKQREQERRVEEALAVFFDAGDRSVAAEEECQRRIEPHERAIAELRQQRDVVVAELEAAQARAALAIHEEGDRTVEQVAELLEMGEKAARRLIAAGRVAAAKATVADQEEEKDGAPGSNSVPDETNARRAEASGDDGPEAAQPAVPSGTGAGAPEAEGWPAEPAGGRDAPQAEAVGA